MSYTTMPYKTVIRLLVVARNPTNGFPARLLGPSRSLCPSGVLSTFGGRTFLGGLGLGSDSGLVLPGFVNRRRSLGFSRVGVDDGLLAGSYLPLNLAGSGTRSRKVAPIFMLGGAGGNRHGRFRGSLSAEESGGCLLNKRTVARPNLPRSFTAFILRVCDFLAKSPIFSLNQAIPGYFFTSSERSRRVQDDKLLATDGMVL